MAEAAKSQQIRVGEDDAARLYPPSWVDRLTNWVDRLPGPAWLCYLLAGAFVLLIISAIKWNDGVFPVGEINLFFVAQAFIVPYMLAMLHHLDNLAAEALSNFRPVLSGDEKEYAELRHRLTTLPSWPALAASALGIAYGALPLNKWTPEAARLLGLESSPLASVVEQVLSYLGWAVAGVFIYHSLHQLRVVSSIFTHRTRIDLFKLGPLYAFSGVAAITSVAIIGGFFLYIAPQLPTMGVPLWTTVNASLFGLVGAVAFFGPMMGAHRLLVKEKQKLMDENSELVGETVAALHRRAREGQFEGMDQLKATQDGLMTEHERLRKTSTWPWRTETLGAVGTALLLPLLITVLDVVLRRIFGP